MERIPDEIIKAYESWAEIANKYHANAGYYDRTHGDNIRLGKRWAKMARLIESAGLNLANTLCALADRRY